MAGRKNDTSSTTPSDLESISGTTIPLDGDPRTPANSKGFKEEQRDEPEPIDGVESEPLGGTEPAEGAEDETDLEGTESLDGVENRPAPAADPESEVDDEPAPTPAPVSAAPASAAPAPAPAAAQPAPSVVSQEALTELADIIGSDMVEKVIKPLVAQSAELAELKAKMAAGEQNQYEAMVNDAIDALGNPRYKNPDDRKLVRSTAEVIYQGAMRAGKPIDGHEALRQADRVMPPAKDKSRGTRMTVVNGVRHRSMTGTIPARSSPTAPPPVRSYAGAIKTLDKKLRDLTGE